jgi:hypothetical protein
MSSSLPSPSHLAADTEVADGAPEDSEKRVMVIPAPDHIVRRPGILKATGERHSSAELRKSIPDGLLAYDHQYALNDDLKYGILDNISSSSIGEEKRNCFHRIFLNPSYPLRRQMMLSFGTVSSLCILLVMIISIIATIGTGTAIKRESSDNVHAWVENFMGSTSRFVAEALSPKLIVSRFSV